MVLMARRVMSNRGKVPGLKYRLTWMEAEYAAEPPLAGTSIHQNARIFTQNNNGDGWQLQLKGGFGYGNPMSDKSYTDSRTN